MTRRRAALAVTTACCLSVLLAGCSAPGVAGGSLVAPGTGPQGTALGRWKVGACHDSRGAPYPDPDSEVRLIRTAGGAVVLVEEHEGYDTIVVTNVSTVGGVGGVGGDSVFQLALKRSSQGPYVREYRVPSDTNRAGRFAIVKDVRAWNDDHPKGGFTAKYARAALACELQPVSGDARPE